MNTDGQHFEHLLPVRRVANKSYGQIKYK